MPSPYYLGQSPDEALGTSPRFLYALRRNDDGEVFLLRSDQLKDKDSIEINIPGPIEENYEAFEPGTDYFDGVASNHEVAFDNLVWTQYRWDNRNMLYYIGTDEGRLIVRINQGYVYPTGTSS